MKKSVFLVLSGIAVGAVGGYSGSGLTARAGEVVERPYSFAGNANASLQSKIEDDNGVGGLALSHLNSELGTSFAWTDGGSWEQCPVTAVQLRCFARNGDHYWRWNYQTPNLKWTLTYGEPE